MDSKADEAVVATNDDAALCKYQAVLKGYYVDPFIEKFLPNKVKSTMQRKAPEINQGYYARSASIAFLVEEFIKNHPEAQIISLGSGYDTLYWRLKSCKDLDNYTQNMKYIEIDMNQVVLHKIMAIKRHIDLSKHIKSLRLKGESLLSEDYNLITFDLRQVDKTPLAIKLFEECNLDINKPTLCLSECVLVYMPIHDSDSLLKWLSENFKKISIVNYEQCNMEDRFGEVMLANLTARHCDLMGVDACKTVNSQIERLKRTGFVQTKAWTLLEVFSQCLLPESIEKIKKLEFLDEGELLEQLLEHYCIVVGSSQDIDWIPSEVYWKSIATKH